MTYQKRLRCPICDGAVKITEVMKNWGTYEDDYVFGLAKVPVCEECGKHWSITIEHKEGIVTYKDMY